MKRSKIILGLLSLVLIVTASVILVSKSQFFDATPSSQVFIYTEYNGTYFPYTVKVVYYPGNMSNINMSMPTVWPVTNSQQDHNAVVQTSCKAILQGVNWDLPAAQIAGGVSIPLTTPPTQLPGANVMGVKKALVMLTQMVGQPLGVTLADNLLFVEMDSLPGSIFAINPVTGQIVWYATGLASYAMNNPIVWNGIVFVTVGDVGFNFANFVHYEKGQYDQIVRGMGYGAIYAFNATDGRLIWMRFTMGEAMPAPAVYNGILAYTTGAGCFIGVNASTGQVIWMDRFAGLFASMSSVNYYVLPNGTPLFIGGFTSLSKPYGLLIAVNGYNGEEVWNATLPAPNEPYNTGMGDVPPAVSQKYGIVVQSTVANAEPNGTVDTMLLAVNATNGKVLWTTNLGRGYTPPAFKGGIPLIVGDTVYVGIPSLGRVAAVNLLNGSILWETRLPDLQIPPSYPGGPRGSPTYYHGLLWVAAGQYIYVLNPHSGKIITMYYVGGRFGIVNPVIAGGTMYLANSYGWVIALPLSQIFPDWMNY
ncbi:outer membrane protein assembly factor BamB family protein [Sulfurisphaera ohwakuensis]|uniref:Outer membrane protein assembly factor BamB n=1 Tax=Sulfurisphaera ohwakuensis TaxID=69656 RepID=A0A650CFK0_SULOH|nr:PQQ-binding-like beta-propeller repeat protein [Sulfurisphaera ohwakuensis]MBB5254141.1 outer membrane protein assembly factor BamB [Sulfurisphaera ohwakuensis]QGR16518.1 PQQ-binding-like beta-propeller repeat protein [Sulfurisphaera ohwakuensis]